MPAGVKALANKVFKGFKFFQTAKSVTNDNPETEGSSFLSTAKMIIGGIVMSIVIILLLMFMVLIIRICYPFIIAVSWLGGGSGNAAASSSSPLSDVDGFYFNQSDGPWADVPYDASGGTIGQAGCGLVSITHCIDVLTGNDFTPDEINEQLKEYYNGETAVYAPGGSSVPKLVEFAVGKYNLTSNHYSNVDDAIADMASGNKVIICSDDGTTAAFLTASGTYYAANHVIMAYKTDGSNVWVKDSGTPGGNSIQYTRDQFAQINYVGWYVLGA